MNFKQHNCNFINKNSNYLLKTIALVSVISITSMSFQTSAQAGRRGIGTGIGIGIGLGILGSQILKSDGNAKNNNQQTNPRRQNRPRVSGDPKVRKTQQALKTLGFYSGPITGTKKQPTIDAILNYQSGRGITPSGALTEQQRAILLQEARDTESLASLGDPNINSSSQREQNKRIQTALKTLNFYTGGIDGQVGPGTRRSIVAYQQQYNKPATGIIIGNDFSELIGHALQRVNTRLAALNSSAKGAPAGSLQTAGNSYQQTGTNKPYRNVSTGSTPSAGFGANNFAPVEQLKADAKVKRPDDIAIIIGNRKYQKGVPPVSYSHRDADAVKAMLVNDLGFSPENIIDVRDAGQGAMRNVFGSEKSHKGQLWRYANTEGKSRIFVYYSGHGAPEISSRKAYLVPVDADPRALEISGYPLSLMYKNLKQVPAKSVTVMLDACFSGDSSNGMLIKSASPLVVPTAPEIKAGNFAVLTASSGTQLASWDDAKGHGIFTSHMVEGMKGAADADGDKKITAGELHKYVQNRVRKAARRNHGRDQMPALNGDPNLVLGSYQ